MESAERPPIAILNKQYFCAAYSVRVQFITSTAHNGQTLWTIIGHDWGKIFIRVTFDWVTHTTNQHLVHGSFHSNGFAMDVGR